MNKQYYQDHREELIQKSKDRYNKNSQRINAKRKEKRDSGKSFVKHSIDVGKVGALYRAGWDIRKISFDVHAEEEDVVRILREEFKYV